MASTMGCGGGVARVGIEIALSCAQRLATAPHVWLDWLAVYGLSTVGWPLLPPSGLAAGTIMTAGCMLGQQGTTRSLCEQVTRAACW